MTTIALPLVAGHDLLTHSRMQCAKQCPRKHYYRYELGVRRSRIDAPLRLGSAVHIGLDAHGKGESDHASISKAVAGYEALPKWAITEETVADWMVERETVVAMLAGYFDAWRDDRAEVVASELAFELPITNPETGAASRTYRVAGKIDKIVRLPDGRLAVREHKTTGDSIDPDSDYWPRLGIDQQISLYYLGAHGLGHAVETVDYDVLRKPSIRPRKVTKAEAEEWGRNGTYFEKAVEDHEVRAGMTETPVMYGARLRMDVATRPEFYYARREIPRLERDLDEFRWELWQQSQALREARNAGRWFRNTSACLNMGRCEYLTLCGNGIAPDEVPEGWTRVPHIHPELQIGDE